MGESGEEYGGGVNWVRNMGWGELGEEYGGG